MDTITHTQPTLNLNVILQNNIQLSTEDLLIKKSISAFPAAGSTLVFASRYEPSKELSSLLAASMPEASATSFDLTDGPSSSARSKTSFSSPSPFALAPGIYQAWGHHKQPRPSLCSSRTCVGVRLVDRFEHARELEGAARVDHRDPVVGRVLEQRLALLRVFVRLRSTRQQEMEVQTPIHLPGILSQFKLQISLQICLKDHIVLF